MINYDLHLIRAIIFDVDGVLSCETIPLAPMSGEPMRTANIKDGYAIQFAQHVGLRIAILSGAQTEAVRQRFVALGVEDIFLGVGRKLERYRAFLSTYALTDSEVIYVGDDIPDYEVLSVVGCPCCPRDACAEVKAVCRYISPLRGGQGVARDIIEQVLRVQNKWMSPEHAFDW